MKLFIYIPTYNRPNAIRAQLSVLALQVAQHKDRVRVLVSDNASTHGIYDDFRKEFGTENICFRKNVGNIGGNANIALGFVFAKQDEFLWILSDNDIVTPTAVEYLLSQLRTDIDFICLPEDIEEEEIIYDWKDGGDYPITKGLGLISAGLYNINTVSPCIDVAFYFHNSSFPHLAVFLASAKYHRRVRFKFVHRNKIIYHYVNFDEVMGDYSLSRVGMPLLAELMPYDKARIFCWGWLCDHGLEMYENRIKRKTIFIQTLALLKKYGIKFRILILLFSLFHFTKLLTMRYFATEKTLRQLKPYRNVIIKLSNRTGDEVKMVNWLKKKILRYLS